MTRPPLLIIALTAVLGVFVTPAYSQVTSETATAFLTAELERLYGPEWAASPLKWVRCPEEQIIEDPLTASCAFRFKPTDTTTREGTAVLRAAQQLEIQSLEIGAPFDQVRKPCRLPVRIDGDRSVVARSFEASGYLRCRPGDERVFLGDLHGRASGVSRVGFRGTGTSGFEEAYEFRCRLRSMSGSRREAVCENAFGDGFTYGFTLAQVSRCGGYEFGGVGFTAEPEGAGVYAIRARLSSCETARRLVEIIELRRVRNPCLRYAGGQIIGIRRRCRVIGFSCRLRPIGIETLSVRCSGPGRRAVTWTSGA